MNTENVNLVRTILTELAQDSQIQEHAQIDVHGEYAEEFPSVVGDFLDMASWAPDHDCGTAACLAGWAATRVSMPPS